MTEYTICDEKTLTATELQQIEPCDVRCVDCRNLFSSDSVAIKEHIKNSNHNQFYKHDPEKETKQAEIKRTEAIFTEKEQTLLLEKLNELKKQADKHNPKMFLAIKTGLSAIMQMKIDEKTYPIALFYAGQLTNKEIIVNILRNLHDGYYLDSFTPKSFVSHSARSSSQSLVDIDLLPKICNKAMITSNVDAIFSGNKPTVNENIRIIDTVLNGNGYESHSAVHGKRGYRGDYNFVWLGTITEINNRIWSAQSAMNNKLYFFRLGDEQNLGENNIEEMSESLNEDSNSLKVRYMEKTVIELWDVLSDVFSENKKIKWVHDRDDKETCKDIINLSVLLTSLKQYLPTKNTNASGSGGTHYNFDSPVREDLEKSNKILYNLARGHAIICGRNYISNEDLEIIIHIVISSLPSDRLRLFEVLLCNGGTVNTIQIEKHTNVVKATALKEMEKLRLLGMVEDSKTNGKSKPVLAVQLKNKYHWVFDNKFKQYWDNISFLHNNDNSKLTNNNEIHYKDNLEKETMKEYNYNKIICNAYSKY